MRFTLEALLGAAFLGFGLGVTLRDLWTTFWISRDRRRLARIRRARENLSTARRVAEWADKVQAELGRSPKLKIVRGTKKHEPWPPDDCSGPRGGGHAA